VAVGGEVVDLHRLHVQRQHAERLDRVDAKQLLVGAAELADLRDVVPLAAGVLDVRDRDQLGLRIGSGFEDLLDRPFAAAVRVGLFLDGDEFAPRERTTPSTGTCWRDIRRRW
jgi:hypothetical protein